MIQDQLAENKMLNEADLDTHNWSVIGP